MIKLYSFWRSSASYRVRIALYLKKVPFEYVPVHLVKDGGEQNKPEYRELNPQGRVPLLVDGEVRLAQSLAIIDYLDSLHPEPRLIPQDALARARVWAFCHAIAADIQPLQNSGVLRYLGETLKRSGEERDMWARHWIQRGLEALEAEQAERPKSKYVFGDEITVADCVLMPQIYNAERFACDTDSLPRLMRIAGHLSEHPAFAAAHPEQQPDAPR